MTAMEQPWYWTVLDLDAASDERAVKRAYARQLKTTRPDDDADAFQRLRAAYEYALGELRHRAALPVPVPEPEPEPPAPVIDAAPEVLEKIAVLPPAPVMLPVQRYDAVDEAPGVLAHTVWTDFLATCELGPLASLAAAHADERLQGFDARDAFELLAARYAADAICPPELRAALVEHFDWAGRAAPILRAHPAIAAALLSRHGADQDWEHLAYQARTDPVLEFLTRDAVPATLPRRWDAHFIGNMRATLQNIRWRHADLLEHRIDHAVFAWWEAQVADKRYFRQTAGWSSVAGIGLWAALNTFMPASDTLRASAILFIVCQLLALAGGASLTLRPPEKFFTRVLELQVRWFGKPLREARYDRAWQLGWMPPFALLSLALLLPDPHPAFSFIIGLGMTGCAAAAVLANSPAITRVRFCAAFVLSIATILMSATVPAFATLPEWTVLCFGLVVFTVFLSDGALLYRLLGWNAVVQKRLRMGWLAAGAALAVLITGDTLPLLQLPALMLLVLAGVTIARYNAGLRLVWIGMIAARALAGAVKQNASDAHFALAIMALVTAYFVVAHLANGTDD